MDILYSNVIELHEGWGAEYFVNQGFKNLGYKTHCIDYRKYRKDIYSKFLQAPKCDVFLLQRGDKFPISIIHSLEMPKLFWASELVKRCRDQDRLFIHGKFDHIFFRTEECINIVVDRGWIQRERCSVLLSGFDETVFQPIKNIKKDIDVLFVGFITERRKNILDRINRYHKVQVMSAFGEDLVGLINRSKIILNIHSEDQLDTETRVFEVLGCGGFLLSEKLSCENPFTAQELSQFNSLEECICKINSFLLDDEQRNTIASNGYKAAIREHTYTMRAKQIADTMLKELDKYNRNHKPGKKNLKETRLMFLRLMEKFGMYCMV